MRRFRPLLSSFFVCLLGCPPTELTDAGPRDVGSTTDVLDANDTGMSAIDASMDDTGPNDVGPPDTGAPDTGAPDAGAADAGAPDTGTHDAGTDDTGAPDTGPRDSGLFFDGSDGARLDGGVTDAGDAAVAAAVPVRVGSMAMPLPAQTSCVGARAMPTAGAGVLATVEVEALALSAFPVPMIPIQLFPGELIRASCDADCVSATTNASGLAAVTLPSGGWFGYRLPAAGAGAMATVPVLGQFFQFASTAGARVPVTAMSTTVASLFASQLNRELDATTSLVSGAFRDCDGQPVAYALIRMFRGSTEICPGGCAPADTTMPRITGLSDAAIPSRSTDGLTRFLGRFAAVVPATGGPLRIEAWGATTDGGPAELLGCEEVRVEPSTATITSIGPRRGDYRPGSGCIRP